jgi:hypothetical protein
MKISLCLLIAALLGIASAQDQTYTFSDDAFSYRVIIYSDVAIGDTAIEIVTNDTANPDMTLSNIGYAYTGLEADGTLHLLRINNDYLIGSEESMEVSTDISGPVSFGGVLGRPFNVDLDIQAGVGSRLTIRLENSDIFEVSTD